MQRHKVEKKDGFLRTIAKQVYVWLSPLRCDRDESFGLRHHQLSVASFDSNDPPPLSALKKKRNKQLIDLCLK